MPMAIEEFFHMSFPWDFLGVSIEEWNDLRNYELSLKKK